MRVLRAADIRSVGESFRPPPPVGASNALGPALRASTVLRVLSRSSLELLPWRRAVAAAIAVVLLSGCGPNFHPGVAAVADGELIQASQVDNLVLAACAYSAQNRISQGGTLPTQSTANLRLAITQALIQFKLIDVAAHRLGVTVSPARIAQLVNASPIPAGITGADRQLLSQFLRESAQAKLQQAVIGAHLRNPKVTSDANVSETDLRYAQGYLQKFYKKQSVVVDPSYGKWTGSKLVPSSGSLSYPVSTPRPGTSTPDLQSLPASQVCG